MAVTANLSINFGKEKDAFLEAEILEADNEGKSTFTAGDTVYFRIYNSGNYTVFPTVGTCSIESTNNVINVRELDEDGFYEVVTFSFSGTASTNKIIYGALTSYQWIGQELSEVKKSNFNEVSGGLNPVTKKADSVGVAEIDYDTKYDLWSYSSPASVNGKTSYTVVIGITATA